MKKKLIIDLILFISTIFLMNYAFTGNFFHEVLGLVMFGFATYHKYKNNSWLKMVFKQIKNKEFKLKFIINYLVDYILWILLLLITITGITMSQSLFAFIPLTIQNEYQIHTTTAILFIVFVVIHTLLHLKLITTFIETKFKIKNKKSLKFILLFIIIALSILGFKDQIDKLTYKNSQKIENNLIEDDEKKEDQTIIEETIEEEDSASIKPDTTVPTLNEYLSVRHCSNCSRRCPLNAISCSKGEAPKQAATEEYYNLYG